MYGNNTLLTWLSLDHYKHYGKHQNLELVFKDLTRMKTIENVWVDVQSESL